MTASRHAQRGRDRAVLEIIDSADTLRTYAASRIRRLGDDITFTCNRSMHRFSQDSICGAIDVESGQSIPALVMRGKDSDTSLHDRISFLNGLNIEFWQSIQNGMPLSFLFAEITPSGNGLRAAANVCDTIALVARHIRQHVRWYDLAARTNDNKVAVLLPGCNRQGAGAVADRLRDSMASACRTAGAEIPAEVQWRSGQVESTTADGADAFLNAARLTTG